MTHRSRSGPSRLFAVWAGLAGFPLIGAVALFYVTTLAEVAVGGQFQGSDSWLNSDRSQIRLWLKGAPTASGEQLLIVYRRGSGRKWILAAPEDNRAFLLELAAAAGLRVEGSHATRQDRIFTL